MHAPATLQNGLARKLAGVSRALKPTKSFAGIAALFAVALLAVLVPAVVFAVAPTGAPAGVSATSGDGTMTLSWETLNGASGGYEYRYGADFGSLVTA